MFTYCTPTIAPILKNCVIPIDKAQMSSTICIILPIEGVLGRLTDRFTNELIQSYTMGIVSEIQNVRKVLYNAAA